MMQVKVLLDPTSDSQVDGVSPDLIASVTHRVPLSGVLKVTEERTARHGDVVLVRVKKINTDYALLELKRVAPPSAWPNCAIGDPLTGFISSLHS